jgi:hypothetical protein
MTRGKYDDQSQRVLQDTSADVAVVIVLGGQKGHGHSMSMRAEPTLVFHAVALRAIAGIFRHYAEAMEQEAERLETTKATMS